ncbi:LamG-like jellyroll fold domain-containing protein [Flavobacterium stagni]|uniref:T9SS type A sorting domain-containing protein n=1 Tax=Flavobacterium stagni TaxID=2506421 RepID=A0A4Q1K8A5_9FLAO|nr:LamG-like jellyroll fold domain-containing protein [Flavobacterium stagni]RXR21983.1 T9SS type A sorting domain-containing protein [Flavobacterium stagni]
MKRILLSLLLLSCSMLLAQTPLYQFNFDGNVNNTGTGSVTTPFSSSSTYVADRNGVANGALNGQATGGLSAAVCPNLPLGNAARTLAFWVRFPGASNQPIQTRVVAWGNNAAAQAFGIDMPTATAINYYTWGTANDYQFSASPSTTQWVHIAFTYDGTTLKRYFNGILLSSQTLAINTVAPGGVNKLCLGRYAGDIAGGFSSFYMDDLRVYGTALNNSQIAVLAGYTLPSISNLTATAITNGTATISYGVNSNAVTGATVDSAMLFGTSPTSLATYLPSSATDNHSATTINKSFNMTSLQPNTTYYYKVEATNTVGSTASPVQSFTTQGNPGTPPTVSNLFTSNVGITSFRLNYDVNANGSATSTLVEYGTGFITNPDGSVTGCNATGTATNACFVDITGLPPGADVWYRVRATSAGGVVNTNAGLVSLQDSYVLNSYLPSNVTSTSGTIDVNLNANGYSGVMEVYYNAGTTFDSNTAVMGYSGLFPATQNGILPVTLSGLTPNTTYSFRIGVAGDGGSIYQEVNSSFTTQFAGSAQPIYHFPFNGSINSVDNLVSLQDIGGSPVTYTSNGVTANNAVLFSANGNSDLQATLPNLPQGNTPRTVLVRAQIPAASNPSTRHQIFTWGSGQSLQAYGYMASLSNTDNLNYFWGSSDLTVAANIAGGTWYNFAFTYDCVNAKAYVDGNLIATSPSLTLNTQGTLFKMGEAALAGGGNFSQAIIDDLKIFNVALTPSQIQSFNSQLSQADFSTSLAFTIAPNPIQDTFEIQTEEIVESVAIFTLQGQLVKEVTTKQVDISDLNTGLYLVQISTNSGAKGIQKVSKK